MAIAIAKKLMEQRAFENVRLQPVIVPFWNRGETEEAILLESKKNERVSLSVCALGGSIGTSLDGVVGKVLEVKSFEELRSRRTEAVGKIVFFNRPMDATMLNTRDAYRGAVNQRNFGAFETAQIGGIAVIVRSMTLSSDDVPHAGAVSYIDTVVKIPAAAISTKSADILSQLIKKDPKRELRLNLSAEIRGNVQSANVIGELKGRERPDEIILIGAHLDSWDKGSGAHDDAAGCAQVIEALSLLKSIGLKPKRTIRVVLFENEESGVRGGIAYSYSARRGNEVHVAAIESDHGGFAPRGFIFEGDSFFLKQVLKWKDLFTSIDAGRFIKDHPGVDIMPLVQTGVPGFGLDTENHRYFDYHHSDHDTIDKVNPRELELGAISIALLAYLLSEM